ncbi:MAG: hypothetical protein JJU10_08505 [Idiomarina sp.]|nr:hypothetical protein [Idiomarina sp.]
MLYPIYEIQLLPKQGVQIISALQELHVFRLEHEWRVFICAAGTTADKVPAAGEAPLFFPTEQIPEHYTKSVVWLTGEQESTLRCYVTMPDRPVIVKPTEPLFIPKDCKPHVYCNLPLQLALHVGNSKEAMHTSFCEPVAKAWFGKNTRSGELCYAFEERIVLEQPEPVANSFRVHAELRIQNRDNVTIKLERINIPTPYLPVYRLDQREYWTVPITISKERVPDELRVHYGKLVNRKHELIEKVGEAHHSLESRTFMRALEAIIG